MGIADLIVLIRNTEKMGKITQNKFIQILQLDQETAPFSLSATENAQQEDYIKANHIGISVYIMFPFPSLSFPLSVPSPSPSLLLLLLLLLSSSSFQLKGYPRSSGIRTIGLQ